MKTRHLICGRRQAILLIAALFYLLACHRLPGNAADPPAHQVRLVAPGNFPRRVHVFEDFETDIERRWWLRGTVQAVADLPAPAGTVNRRACRAAETLNFDRKMGDRTNPVKGVVFNPVPGPPMSGRTRLSFRYRIAGSDRIQVQIYSLSKGYHRYLVIADLPQQQWRTATVDMTQARRPDGSGGPLAEDERIDDIQFYVARDAELWIDDIVLYDAAGPDESRPFPRRLIFTGWFDTGKQGAEWPGDFEIVPHRPPLTWDAVRSVPHPATGRPRIRVGLRGQRQLGHHTAVTFQYRLSGGKKIDLTLVNSASGQRFPRQITAAVVDQWTEATLNFRWPARQQPRPPTIDEVLFEIESEATLEIDDLLVYEPE